MLDTYIKKQGITQTIVHDNNKSHFNQINWDADYDGDIANLSINSNVDGKRDTFNISLDNEDLANILNIPSVNMPIDKRLQLDFQEPYYRVEHYKPEHYKPEHYKPEHYKPEHYKPEHYLEFPTRFTIPELEPSRKPTTIKDTTIKELINRGISSPSPNEELIVPLTIDKKTMDDYILTPKKRHRRRKTHITHKVYKKNKSSSKYTSKSSNKKTRSLRKSF